MSRTAFAISTMAFVAALGCGGREIGTDSGTSGAGSSSGSNSSVVAGLDGSTVGGAKVPLYHRATHATCPSQRGPGAPGPPSCATPPPPSSVCCTSDSDCDGGSNGRCLNGGRAGTRCTYDECFSDSNCPSGTPCICRTSSADNASNACVTGSRCVIDSDCGPSSYCSPSPAPSQYGCQGPGPYFCHTASDACIDDADCFVDGGGGFFCAYDPQAHRWGCTPQFCPP